MMMEYGFNEILLVKFITKYFAFDANEQLISRGYTLMGQIISELIRKDKNIKNLEEKDIKRIIQSVLEQYSYRFGGVKESLAAFGNFSFILESQLEKSESVPGNILDYDEVRKIIAPIKDQLLKISFYLQHTNQYSTLTQQETTNRKVQFLNTLLTARVPQPIKIVKKKRKVRQTKKKDNASKVKNKAKNTLPKPCCDLQTSIRTQADEQTITIEIKTFKPQKTSTGTSTVDESIQLEENHQLLLRYDFNDNSQQQHSIPDAKDWPLEDSNKLIIRYDDFLPFEQVELQGKKVTKRQKKKEKKQNKKVQRLINPLTDSSIAP